MKLILIKHEIRFYEIDMVSGFHSMNEGNVMEKIEVWWLKMMEIFTRPNIKSLISTINPSIRYQRFGEEQLGKRKGFVKTGGEKSSCPGIHYEKIAREERLLRMLIFLDYGLFGDFGEI
ncbi:hypothetical protein APICC_01009 [Apis cerana cerana]|uniref:Uncharacterized protein n=1 Tax=Apis cerana cerana TaxID=94128 RepID=A0A2A3E6P0_APICC|nr:hypothetical protein APICC_01009 [Apis cerana cerana]